MICKKKIARKLSLLIFAFFLLTPFSVLFAQTVAPEPKAAVSPFKRKINVKQKIKSESGANKASAEKSIAVDAKVNIQLCVSEGKLKINGWERSEIRAFVGGGSRIGFEVLQKNGQNNSAIWVKVLGFDPAKEKEEDAEKCLSGEEIELDVPRGAFINIKSSQSDTTIDSVRKATIEIDAGDIFLNNVAQGIEAKTFEGDITVENSSGAMTLNTTTGNIVAFGVSPSDIGDVFKAKTSSGAIALQRIGHRQAEASSNSGSIKFVGEFQSGGQYKLATQNGSISLLLPEKSSFKLNASFGFGVFNYDVPLQNIQKNSTSKAQSLSAQMGSGDAALNLKTVSGAIRIKKQ